MDKLAKGQLASPIGLGHSFPATAGADFFIRTVAAHLRFGQLYYYYMTGFPAPSGEEEEAPGKGRTPGEFGPVNLMYPFTPLEIHEGWMLGEERLITCVSGQFPWPYPEQRPVITVFDEYGVEIEDPEVKVLWRGGEYSVEVNLRDWHHIAIAK